MCLSPEQRARSEAPEIQNILPPASGVQVYLPTKVASFPSLCGLSTSVYHRVCPFFLPQVLSGINNLLWSLSTRQDRSLLKAL